MDTSTLPVFIRDRCSELCSSFCILEKFHIELFSMSLSPALLVTQLSQFSLLQFFQPLQWKKELINQRNESNWHSYKAASDSHTPPIPPIPKIVFLFIKSEFCESGYVHACMIAVILTCLWWWSYDCRWLSQSVCLMYCLSHRSQYKQDLRSDRLLCKAFSALCFSS